MLGRLFWVLFQLQEKVPRPPVRIPAKHLQSKQLTPCCRSTIDTFDLDVKEKF